MGIVKNKKVSSIALVWVIIFSILLASCLSIAIARSISTVVPLRIVVPTSAYLSVSPNPVVVNQSVSMYMWLNVSLPNEYVERQTGWSNFTVEVTKPDGASEKLGPHPSDLSGSLYIGYTPTQVGTYLLVFYFNGEYPRTPQKNYLPSTSEQVSLSVREPPMLSGHVYTGNVGDTSTPLSDVTVELYCSNSLTILGEFVDSKITDNEGVYILEPPTGWELYTILVRAPVDYTYVGAETVGGLEGTWTDRNGIRYEYPLLDKTLNGNDFWFTSPPPVSIPTSAYLSVAPDNVTTNQEVSLTMWLNVSLPTDYVETKTGWSNLRVEVTEPDGSKETFGPLNSNLSGYLTMNYIPAQIGSYTFVFTFLGETTPSGNYYESSTSEEVSLIIQEITQTYVGQPLIEAIDPDRGQCAQELTITIYGDNFTAETVVFISDGIDVIEVNFISSGELKVEIYISPDAQPEAFPVEVRNPDGSSYVLRAGFEVSPTESPRLDLRLIAAVFVVFGGIGAILSSLYFLKWKKSKKAFPQWERIARGHELPIQAERIVNTGFSSHTLAGEPLDPALPLVPGQSYYFWFEVGPMVKGTIEVKPEPLPVELLPQGARLKVVLFAFDGEIEITTNRDAGEIQIMRNWDVKVASQVERPKNIPPDTNLLDQRLFFPIRTPNREGEYRLRCNIYYQQILVQSRLIKVLVARSQVRSNTPVLQSSVEYSMSKAIDLRYLVHMKPQTLSVMLNDNRDGTHSFRIVGAKGFKNSVSFNATILKNHVEKIRMELRSASWGTKKPWTKKDKHRYDKGYNEEQLRKDLALLAIQGYRFWFKFAPKITKGKKSPKKFSEITLKPGIVEFAVKDPTEASKCMFPAALIYDYPLETNANLKDYTLCKSFLESLKAHTPLKETRCFKGDCPSRGEKKVICPSGFWGFRHSIGVPLGSAYETSNEISYQNTPKIVGAAFLFPTWSEHRKALESLNTEIPWKIAYTRDGTLKLLKSTKPHVVYFYCEGGAQGDVPYIQVGNEKEKGITPDTFAADELWWDDPQPLVFVNGCRTAALEPKLMLDFVSAFVTCYHAAGVIGTEIQVFEQFACVFGEECLRNFLVKGDTIGEAVRTTRLKLLGRGNPLGLIYTIYANSSLRLKKMHN